MGRQRIVGLAVNVVAFVGAVAYATLVVGFVVWLAWGYVDAFVTSF